MDCGGILEEDRGNCRIIKPMLYVKRYFYAYWKVSVNVTGHRFTLLRTHICK
jgi:hypothetical protein